MNTSETLGDILGQRLRASQLGESLRFLLDELRLTPQTAGILAARGWHKQNLLEFGEEELRNRIMREEGIWHKKTDEILKAVALYRQRLKE